MSQFTTSNSPAWQASGTSPSMSPDDSFKRFQSSCLTVAIDFHETVLSSSGSDIAQYSNLFISGPSYRSTVVFDAALCQSSGVPEAS